MRVLAPQPLPACHAMRCLLVVACVLGSPRTEPVLTNADAKASLQEVQTLMAEIEPLAKSRKQQLQQEVNSTQSLYQTKRVHVLRLMQADAKLNGISVSSLDPRNYGLGGNPQVSPEMARKNHTIAFCDRVIAASQDILRHFSEIGNCFANSS